jgi:uncharacterized protein (TIGR03435 family)
MGAGMTSGAIRFAARLVRLWARVYTLGMPAGVRDARLSDIECDLWEGQHDPGRPANAFEMLARLLLGVPHDLIWRFEQPAADGAHTVSPARRAVAASAFTCSLTLHLIFLACAVWWASWPADRPPSRWTSRAQSIEGPALLAGAPLTVAESEWPAKPAPSRKDTAMKKAALLIGTLVTAAGLPIVAPLGQARDGQQAASDPAFEVASIRPSTSAYAGWRLEPQAGGRLTGTNVPAAALIRFAYDLPDFQISGGPGWLASDRFDVEAKAEGDPPLDQKRLMLRTLLAERFKLTVHTETRELPIYALVMARSDGRPGAQLRRTEADCAREAVSLDDWAGVGPATGTPRCGFFGFAPGTDLPRGRGGLAFRGLTLAMFAKRLVPIVRRAVSDETRLTGYFDADFDFVAELPPPPPPPGLPNAFGSDPFTSVFTVLPEQLGLKLDSRRGPVDVLVIDRVEPPAPE